MAGLGMAAVLYLPSLLEFQQLHGRDLLPLVDHPPVGRGRVGDDPGRLPRLPADPPVRHRPRSDGEVAVRDRRAGVHLGHHRHRAPLLLRRRAALLAADRRRSSRRWSRCVLSACRPMPTRPSAARACRIPTRWPCTGPLGSAIFSALGAGLLGLAHTWPAVNQWTHGTLITAMHGHAAFFGAYVMIVLAMITYALPALTGARRVRARDRRSAAGRSGCRSAACSG